MAVKRSWIDINPESIEQLVPPGHHALCQPVDRFEKFIEPLAVSFALERYGYSVELRFGKRGLHADDTAAFIRAVEQGYIAIQPNGSFDISSCRPKPGGTRYSLFTANRWNNDHYISLNTENLIHYGAAAELHFAHGWAADQIEVEVGEFDARVWDNGRVVLLMEAKARVVGADSLAPLLNSFLAYGKQPDPPEAKGNHSRKYVELLKQAEAGPVLLWLVAAGARWAFIATRVGDTVQLEEGADPGITFVRSSLSKPRETGMKRITVQPEIDHAVARALLTEIDTRQRVYEHPWKSKDEMYGFITKLKVAMKCAGIEHTKPWVWTAETSTGKALTHVGKDTGIELRFSYSP